MRFRNEFYFLSNMYPCKIVYKDYVFNNAEAFFQACKDGASARKFVGIDGFTAKRLGRTVKLRPNWNEIRTRVMKRVLIEKFRQNPDLMEKLKSIKGPIVEDNDWNDTFWGCCRGVGRNELGKILEEIRGGAL